MADLSRRRFVTGLAVGGVATAAGMLLPLLAAALFIGQQWGARPGWPAGTRG